MRSQMRLRWRTSQNRQLRQIPVLGNEHKAVSLCEKPEVRIAGASEIQQARLRAPLKDVSQSSDELVRDVVIKEQFHA